MILDKEFLFLEKGAYSGCPVSIYRFFKRWRDRDNAWSYYSVTKIVKHLLRFYTPNECIKAIAKSENTKDAEWLKGEYLHLFNYMAAIHFDYEEYTIGTLWAQKAIDYIDILYPYLNFATREKMKKESSAQYMLECHQEFFDYSLYLHLNLEWETNDYIKLRSSIANDNRKKSLRLD